MVLERHNVEDLEKVTDVTFSIIQVLPPTLTYFYVGVILGLTSVFKSGYKRLLTF